MKCIDDEIPFEIPEGWEWARMGNIGDWGSGSTPQRGNSSYYGGSIPWLKTGELNDGVVYDTAEKITDKALKECSLRLNKIGDVLIAMYGATIGKVAIAGIDLTTNQACCGCTPIIVYNEYLFYFLMASKVDFVKKGEGGAQPNISREKLVSHLMPIPPIDEQQRIVLAIKHILPYVTKYTRHQTELDRLNASIKPSLKKAVLQEAIQGKLVPQDPNDEPASVLLERIREEKLRLLKEGKLKKKDITDSVIFKGEDNRYYEQVGLTTTDITEQIPFDIPASWSWVRLAAAANLYTGNSISDTEKKARYTAVEGTEYIGTKDVGFDHKVDYSNGVNIPEQYLPYFKIAPRSSVLLCIEGGSAGRKVAIVDKDVCFGNKLCCLSPYKSSLSKYLFYYLQSPIFFESFRGNLAGIIGGVSVNTLKTLIMPLPPQVELQRIVKHIEELFEHL